MKLLYLVIIYNLVIISPQNLRNLILMKDTEKYNKLVTAATNTFFQIHQLKVDFQDTYFATIEDETKKLTVLIDENDPDIPSEEKISFEITNGKPQITDLINKIPDESQVKDIKMQICDQLVDVKEKFKAIANSISAGLSSGTIYLYKKQGENFSQMRYKCFVKDESGQIIGSFEIMHQDKNDSSQIVKDQSTWYEKVKTFVKEGTDILNMISGTVANFVGIAKDIKQMNSNSPFLKVSLLSLIISLFLF